MGEPLAEGDLCDLYHCTFDEAAPAAKVKAKNRWERLMGDSEPKQTEGVIKIARSVNDNDLVLNEGRVLAFLYPPDKTGTKFYRYLTRPYGSSKLESRNLNAMAFAKGYLSFEDILKACPEGIDYRDLAWMLKRLLAAIGFAHYRGLVHGALLPPHVLVHPVKHGAKVIDWSYAVGAAGHKSIKAYSADWRAYYPPEVFAKQFPGPGTDLYMVAKCVVALLGGNVINDELPDTVPGEIQAFLAKLLHDKPSMRPDNAWELHDEFDGILGKLVGKPIYRRFRLPDRCSTTA